MLKRINRSGVLYVAPAMVVVGLVMLYPLLYTLVMGFFEKTLNTKTPVFVGFDQYASLFGNKVFVNSISHTMTWTFGSVLFQFTFGFMVALLLHQPFVKYKTVLRILLMVPWVLPSVIGSAVWKWMFNADYGIINFVLKTIGVLDKSQTWLSSPKMAMNSVIAVNVWKMFPFVLMMVEAALQGVSKYLKEAAVIDGANPFQIFKAVTWPAISGTCYSVLLLLIIWTLNAFTFIYTLTDGGPAHKTEVMAMFIYKKAFAEFNFGQASAASVILFTLSMIVCFVYNKITKSREE